MQSSNVPTSFILLISAIFLIAGTAQTVSLKWADKLSAPDRLYSPKLYNKEDFLIQFNRQNGNINANIKKSNNFVLGNYTSSISSNSCGGGCNDQTINEESNINETFNTYKLSTIMNSNVNKNYKTMLTSTVNVQYSFAHPFTQAFFMFSGEAICLVVFVAITLYRRYLARRVNHRRAICAKLVAGVDIALPCNVCVWILTAGADFLASIIQNVGLVLTDASLFQMLRGAAIVWVGLISYFWLHRRFIKVEYWGMAFVVIGLTLVGASTLTVFDSTTDNVSEITENQQTHSRESLQTLGNVLVISAQILHAYQGVCQERIVRLYQVPPLQMIGIEGVYGISLTVSLLAFLQLVPMTWRGHNVESLLETYAFLNNNKNYSTYSSQRYSVTPSLKADQESTHLVDIIPLDVTYYDQHHHRHHHYSIQRQAEADKMFTKSWVDTSNISWLNSWSSMHDKVSYDDFILAFDQMHQSVPCRTIALIYITSGFVYNAAQMFIIKYLSAAALVMIGSLRNISVWAFCLCLPSVFGECFRVLQFIGFVFLMVGNVLFQRVWITHFDEILPQKIIHAWPSLFRDVPETSFQEQQQTPAASPSTGECKNAWGDPDSSEMVAMTRANVNLNSKGENMIEAMQEMRSSRIMLEQQKEQREEFSLHETQLQEVCSVTKNFADASSTREELHEAENFSKSDYYLRR